MEATKKKSDHRIQMGELRYAMIASALTLVGAVGIYSLIPYLHNNLLSSKMVLPYTRSFESSAVGGRIVYSMREGVKSDAASIDRLETDLHILERRFRAGKFDMTTLPGSRSAPPVVAMIASSTRVDYLISRNDNGVVMELRAKDATALKSLQDYLLFLKNNWFHAEQ